MRCTVVGRRRRPAYYLANGNRDRTVPGAAGLRLPLARIRLVRNCTCSTFRNRTYGMVHAARLDDSRGRMPCTGICIGQSRRSSVLLGTHVVAAGFRNIQRRSGRGESCCPGARHRRWGRTHVDGNSRRTAVLRGRLRGGHMLAGVLDFIVDRMGWTRHLQEAKLGAEGPIRVRRNSFALATCALRTTLRSAVGRFPYFMPILTFAFGCGGVARRQNDC